MAGTGIKVWVTPAQIWILPRGCKLLVLASSGIVLDLFLVQNCYRSSLVVARAAQNAVVW